MDELVELLELLLVVDFLGVGRNSAQAIHDVVLHKHGGIAAHGKGNGITGTGVDLALLAIGQYDDRRSMRSSLEPKASTVSSSRSWVIGRSARPLSMPRLMAAASNEPV